MTVWGFMLLLLIAGIVGAVGQAIAGYSHGGCLGSIAIGFIGALLGSWLAGLMDLPKVFEIDLDGTSFPVVWALLGSVLFVVLLSLVTRGRRPRV